MKKLLATLAILSCAAAHAQEQYPADNPGFIRFNNDAGTGVSVEKRYTHAVNFDMAGIGTTTLEGVVFVNRSGNNANAPAASGSVTGHDGKTYGWSGFPGESWASGPNSPYTGNAIDTPPGNVVYNMLYAIIHNGGLDGSGTMRVTGLTEGCWYELSFFIRCIDENGASRWQRLVFDNGTGNPITFDYNQDIKKNDRLLVYRYQAGPSEELVVHYANLGSPGYDFCLGAFMNEELGVFTKTAADVTKSSATLAARASLWKEPDSIAVFWAAASDVSEVNWESCDSGAPGGTFPDYATNLTSLASDQNYFFRFKAELDNEVFWSEPGKFQTYGPYDVVTKDAVDVTMDSAKIPGVLLVMENTPQDILLYWGAGLADFGDDPGDWPEEPIALQRSDTGEFSVTLENLDYSTWYSARYALSNGTDVVMGSPAVSFLTEPYTQPVLGAVNFAFSPAASTVTVEIVSLTLGNELILEWDDGTTSGAITNSAPAVGGNLFGLPVFPHGAALAWRALLTSIDPRSFAEKSGSIKVAHIYIWIGGAGDLKWKSAGNWDCGVAPDHPGAVVRIPGANHTFDIEGAEPVTIGSFWASSGISHITGSEGAALVFDNEGLPARVDVVNSQTSPLLHFHTPVQLAGETRVHVDSYVPPGNVCFYGGVTSPNGLGSFWVESEIVTLGAPLGETRVVEVPLLGDFSGKIPQYNIRNQGTVVLANQDCVTPFGWDNYRGFVGSGDGAPMRLVLSNTLLRSVGGTCHLFWGGLSFIDVAENSTLTLETGLTVTSIFKTDHDNTLTVIGAGSRLVLGDFVLLGFNNAFDILDGGEASMGHYKGQFDWGLSFSVPQWGNSDYGSNNRVRVASAVPGATSLLDLNGRFIAMNGDNCVLHVGAGGVVTNVNNIALSRSGNLLSLEGGAVGCNNLAIADGNALGVVLTANGIQPVKVANTATFGSSVKIICSNPGNVAGSFDLVNAATLNLPEGPLNDLLDAPANYNWKLDVVPGENNTQTLRLSCSKTGTLLLLK